MNLQQKRKVIELLLHGADVNGIGDAIERVNNKTWEMAVFHRQASADDISDKGVDDYFDKYVVSCLEAAYRLIESSPTLKKEWFRK